MYLSILMSAQIHRSRPPWLPSWQAMLLLLNLATPLYLQRAAHTHHHHAPSFCPLHHDLVHPRQRCCSFVAVVSLNLKVCSLLFANSVNSVLFASSNFGSRAQHKQRRSPVACRLSLFACRPKFESPRLQCHLLFLFYFYFANYVLNHIF